MRCISNVLMLILSMLSFLAFSQSSESEFKYISFNEGLSNAYVRSIAQDDAGYIWIATDDGLNKFNGYEMVVYRNDPSKATSIINNSIGALLKDRKGRLWVGTEGGLDLYDPDMDHFIHVKNAKGYIISALFESSDSLIWIGTSQGIALYSEEKQEFQKVYFNYGNSRKKTFDDKNISINVFKEYDSRTLIVGTWEGIFVIDKKLNTLKHISRNSNEGQGINQINTIEIDGNKNIWVGTNGSGFFHFDMAKDSLRKMKISTNCQIDNRILSIVNDHEGHIWIGTEQSGLYKLYINSYDQDGYEYEHFIDNELPGSLSYRTVTCILKVADSGLWIGTHNGGLNYLGAERKIFKTIRRNPFIGNTLSHKKVWGICEGNQENIWIGTDGGGLDQYNPINQEIRNFSADGKPGSISDNAILSAYKDNEGDLWFGTYEGGLNLYEPAQQKFKTFRHKEDDSGSISNNDVRAIIQDNNGNIWIGTNQGGLNVLNKSTGSIIRNNTQNSNIGSNDIRAFHIDKKQRLWIGTFGQGLYLFDKGKFQNFRLEKPNSNDNIIFSIKEDASGALWLGTYRSGLVRFDPETKKFKIFDENKGLANNIIHGLTIDLNNNIWLSTNKGISKFNINSETFINYNTSDGLPTLAFNDGSVLHARNGLLYFGSIDGLVYFDPNQEYQQPNPSKVIIEELRVFNRIIKPDSADNQNILKKGLRHTDHITFSYNQSVFSLQYAAIHFANPDKMQYAYMLEGVEKQWNYVDKLRNVTFTALPAGEYMFKVKASLDNNNWSDETKMMITVLPPIWKTWWAYSFYFIVIGLLLYASRHNRLNKIKMERRIEIEQLEKKKLSEIYNLKMNFFTNISHEFRTPLTLIISPLEQIIRDQIISGPVKDKLLSIYNHANRLLNLINQLMEFRKVETGNMQLKVTENDVVKFTYEVFHAFAELAQVNKINYQFISDVDSLKLWFNQIHFETILYNLISNAFKYTANHGQISVEIKGGIGIDQEYCEVHIVDNGKGISPEYIDQVFNRYYQVIEAETINIMGTGIGLALVKDLVELHRGEIKVKSQKEKGSEIILRFKKGNAHFSENQVLRESVDSEHPRNYEVNTELLAELPAINIQHNGNGKHFKHAILIIEDNADIRKYVKSLFSNSYKILEAENGEEGFNLAKAKSPSVIISDIMMPGIDGIELCKQLKKHNNTLHIPVVLLTARADDLHKLEGISIEAYGNVTMLYRK